MDYLGADGTLTSNNLFAYCKSNPVMGYDPTGRFPWLIVAVITVCTLGGAALGATSNEKLGAQATQNSIESKTPTKNNESTQKNNQHANLQQKDNTAKLTTRDRIKNGFIGAGLGLATGGGIIVCAGAIGTVAVGSGSVLIPAFGATGLQTVATGALSYDIFALLFAPFFGVEMEPIEIEP